MRKSLNALCYNLNRMSAVDSKGSLGQHTSILCQRFSRDGFPFDPRPHTLKEDQDSISQTAFSAQQAFHTHGKEWQQSRLLDTAHKFEEPAIWHAGSSRSYGSRYAWNIELPHPAAYSSYTMPPRNYVILSLCPSGSAEEMPAFFNSRPCHPQ